MKLGGSLTTISTGNATSDHLKPRQICIKVSQTALKVPLANGNWGPLRQTTQRFSWDIKEKWLNIIRSREKSIFHDSLMLQKKKCNSVLWHESGSFSSDTCGSCLPWYSLPSTNWKIHTYAYVRKSLNCWKNNIINYALLNKAHSVSINYYQFRLHNSQNHAGFMSFITSISM